MGSELRRGDDFDVHDVPSVQHAEALLALGDPAEPRRFVGFVTVDVAGTPTRFHLKRYRYATWRASLGLLGRGTLWGTAPELAEFEALRTLARHGIPAVRPAAACAVTRGGRLVAHALLTHAAPEHALALETRLRDPDDPILAVPARRRALCRRLGALLARMHAIPFVHRDLRARNLLVAEGGSPEDDADLWLLDCRKGGPGGRADAAGDLAALDRDLRGRVPRGDRAAALRAARGARRDRKALLARIARLRADVPPPRPV